MRLNRSLLSLLPLFVGAVSLVVTGWLWSHERQVTERSLKADFDFSVRQTASRIEQRMASYEQMLRGVQGLFRASDPIDAGRFRAYVDALLEGADFAGIHAFAYAPFLPGGDAPSAPVNFVAPGTSLNLKGLGDDAYADPLRRGAMLLARDSGSLGITPRVAANVEPEGSAPFDFQMFLPVYRQGQPIESAEARRAALAGWVFAGVRMADLMSSLYGEGTPGIEVRVHDGVDLSRQTLMYQSGPGHDDAPVARFDALEYIGFAGHTWTLRIMALPAFEQHHGGDSAQVIAIAGAGLSALLALLTGQLVSGRSRAHELATAMTGELRASEERYRRIVETADEGIWMTDTRDLTSFVNPKMAQMLGRSPLDMIGRPMADFLGDSLGDSVPAPATRDVAGQRPEGGVRRELMFRHLNGSPLWSSVATTPIFDTAGNDAGTLAMVADITERKRADATRAELEAQVRESQKMEAIGTLAGGIAHDFNNILAAILGNVSLAQQQPGVGPEAQGNLAQIRLAAVRARSLVQQILAFSRKQPHRLVSQPLRPLIEDSVRLMRPILPAGVELELKLADTPIHVAVDATQMQQVVMNLCTNAWHAHNGQAGRITVGLATVVLAAEAARSLGLLPGRHAHLWVGDTGCGMDEATRARVFEPFFTTKPVGLGTGLGLSVVHGIVATHGGAITVDSTAGQGSRFDLYFPLVEPPAAVMPMLPSAAEPPPGAGQHVLYVDDDPVMVLMVQGLLQRCGYRVSAFEDPREAMAALRARPDAVDVVVTDHNMPGLSGLDIARELARLRPGLPVLISSGHVSEELLAAAAQAGVRSVMQKEYTLEQLAGLVHRVLAGPADPTRPAGVAGSAP